MAKSIVSIAIGMALAEGKIASLDDMVAKYVPKLAGVPYGETSIRNVLRMSSGVTFREVYDGNDDLDAVRAAARHSKDRSRRCACSGIARPSRAPAFTTPPARPSILAVLLHAVTGTTLSDYLTARLWQPMGAEADATWIKTPDGIETGSGSFNATLRDYGRLGMLLANDGAVGGRQIVPKDYLLEATDWHRQPQAFAPRRATPFFGYGYQFWTFPGEKRRFALLGVYGQSIFVDPELKLVMVVTAAARNASVGKEPFAAGARRGLARDRQQVWQLVAGRAPQGCRYRFLVPSRGMHFLTATTPAAVIWAPDTSLIWPEGQEPSSTRMRWPNRRLTMSCSRATCCAIADGASAHSASPAANPIAKRLVCESFMAAATTCLTCSGSSVRRGRH